MSGKCSFVLEKYGKPQSDFCTNPVSTEWKTERVREGGSGDRDWRCTVITNLCCCGYFSRRQTHSRQFSSQTAVGRLSCSTMVISLGRPVLTLEVILWLAVEAPEPGWVLHFIMVAVLLRPSDDSREDITFCCFTRQLFFQLPSNLRDGLVLTSQKCVSGSFVGVAWKICSDIPPSRRIGRQTSDAESAIIVCSRLQLQWHQLDRI